MYSVCRCIRIGGHQLRKVVQVKISLKLNLPLFKEKYFQFAGLLGDVGVSEEIPPNKSLSTFHRSAQILCAQFAGALTEVAITLKKTFQN